MKIIRDKLAEKIIAEEGEGRVFKSKSQWTSDTLIRAKILEEAEEVYEAIRHESIAEEVGDLLEVLEEHMEREGVTMEEVNKAREAKSEKLGLFKKNYILTEIKK